MIEVSDLRHAFNKPVLEGVSFSVGAGEIVGYLGPNGAGKSTTIRILCGMLAPTSGHVRVLGLDPAAEPTKVKALIGYVPESGALYETFSPLEYLTLIGRLHGLTDALIEDRATRMLDAFDLRGKRETRMTGFSKGMKQKVVLVAALLHDPQVLFLDEPLNGLDAASTVTVKETMRGLARLGKTIFWSSHLMDVVERVADRVIVLDHGHVVADGPITELRARSGDKTLEELFQRLTHGDEAKGRAEAIVDVLSGATHAPGPAVGATSAPASTNTTAGPAPAGPAPDSDGSPPPTGAS
jgi:ABC-2 type transport system ATP-binding protein